jgi:predicted permease
MFEDLKYALRTFRTHKAFTATALLAVAIGIGSITAIFTVVNRTILRPLPFVAADRLVQIYGAPEERGQAIAASDVEEFRTAATSFESIAGYNVEGRYLQGPESLERVLTVDVERSFFSMLGVVPLAGRTFLPDDVSNVAVASESFWRRRWLGDAAAIGSAVTLDGARFTIVGVMPDSFQFPYGAASLLRTVASQQRTDLWVVREPVAGQPRRGRFSLVTGRLKPNVTSAAAQTELSGIMQRLNSQSIDRPKDLGVRIVPLADAIVSRPLRRSLFILFGAAALVLLLVCANVTNLLLVRTMMRTKEIATRMALGAGSGQLIRQFLTEGLLIALSGGIAGLGLAGLGTVQLMNIAAAHLPRSHEGGMDWRVYGLSLSLCVGSGLVFGLAQLFSVIRTDPQSVLKQTASHQTMSISQRRFRDGLVAAEVALAFVLGLGAAMQVRELVRLRNTDSGFTTGNVISIHVGQQLAQAGDGKQYYEIVDRVRRLPGVREAGFTQMLPLQSWGWSANSFQFPYRVQPQADPSLFTMELRYVTPGYFQTLGIPIKKGRGFAETDIRGSMRVIVINETLARLAFPGEDPVGKETTRGTVVGIVGDVRQVNLDREASPEIYYPIAQNWSQIGDLGMSLVVRTSGPPLALADAIRGRIREVNPNLAIFDIKTMDRVVAESMSDFLLYLTLMTIFAAVALFLALTGTYGVISYIATSRTREFAIRSALGARRSDVVRIVLLDAIRLTNIGIGFGLVAAFAASPLLHNLPVSVRPPDAVTITPIAVLLTAAAITACLIPARRAASADLMSTLRNE